MTRLLAEWHRLYVPSAGSDVSSDEGVEAPLIDAQGRVRAMVLTLARPADWAAVWSVWQGVQADLGWPAPAIAVSGVDAYQLWFSLAEPLSAARAHELLQGLQRRYWGDMAPVRIERLPGIAEPLRHAARVPARQAQADQWSAFVAPDLAPMFADTPWLDLPPSPEGQADLLSRLHSIPPAAVQAAWARLAPGSADDGSVNTVSPALPPGDRRDPRGFLLEVMNDERVDLALRIEAAKALLHAGP